MVFLYRLLDTFKNGDGVECFVPFIDCVTLFLVTAFV